MRKRPDERQNLADELRIERARDLVEEHEVRVHGERASDRHTLLLAAGEPVRVLVLLVLQADEGEQLTCSQPRLRLRHAARPDRREGDVLQHRHVRKEVERLKDDPDLLTERIHVDLCAGDRLAVDHDRPLVDLLEQIDAAQKRRFARPRGADQADHLMKVDSQVDPLQDLEVAEALRDVLERDEVRVRLHHTAWARSRLSRSLIRWSVKRASGIVRMMKKTAATVKPA